MKDDTTDDRPLTSDEMIARARRRREDASKKLIDQALSSQRLSSDDLIRGARKAAMTPPDVGDLAELEIDLTPEVPEAELPDAILQPPRPRRVRRTPMPQRQGPVSSDPSTRATAAIMAAVILLITIGAIVAAVAANSTP